MLKAILKKFGVYFSALVLFSLTSACTKEQQQGVDNWCRLGTQVHGDYMVCRNKAIELYNRCENDINCGYEGLKVFCDTVTNPGVCFDWWKDKIKELYQNSISPTIPSGCSPTKNSLDAAISSGQDSAAVIAAQALTNCVSAGGGGGNGCGSGSFKSGGGLGFCTRPNGAETIDTDFAPVMRDQE
jgi:hypothetical protein